MTVWHGYIPFVAPLNFFQDWWYLLVIPLCFGISVVYKAMRLPVLDDFWRQVATMTTQIILAMIGLAVALIFFVQVVLPRIPVN